MRKRQMALVIYGPRCEAVPAYAGKARALHLRDGDVRQDAIARERAALNTSSKQEQPRLDA
jgi:hypothetical protein